MDLPIDRETLSIIIPCFNEEACLEKFFSVLKETCQKNEDKFKIKTEVVFINDGSTDKTSEILERLARKEVRNLCTKGG